MPRVIRGSLPRQVEEANWWEQKAGSPKKAVERSYTVIMASEKELASMSL